MNRFQDDFARFEHEGWQRVADKYDFVWAPLTRQFIPSLLEDASVSAGMLVLDVACGPGYVSAAAKQLGAIPTGIDFSDKNGRDREANVSGDSIQARRRTRPAI